MYSWDGPAGKWCFAGIEGTEDDAKKLARRLWRAGASGVRIEESVRRVTLEHRR